MKRMRERVLRKKRKKRRKERKKEKIVCLFKFYSIFYLLGESRDRISFASNGAAILSPITYLIPTLPYLNTLPYLR